MNRIVFLCIWLCASWAQAAPPSVVLNTLKVAHSPEAAGQSPIAATLTIPAVAVPSGAAQILVVCSAARAGATAPAGVSVSWNGHALDLIAQSSTVNTYSNTAACWTLSAPEAATADALLTVDRASYLTGFAYVISGTTGINRILERPGTPNTNVTSTQLVMADAAADSLLVDAVIAGHGGAHAGVQVAGQTEFAHQNTIAQDMAASSRVGPGALGWKNVSPGDGEATRWAQVMMEFAAVNAPPMPPPICQPGCVVPMTCSDAGPFLPDDGGFAVPGVGTADDTAAIQAAISAGGPSGFGKVRNLEFGTATANLSNELFTSTTNGVWENNVGLYGHGRDASMIRAIDHSAAFQGAPRALYYTASQIDCGGPSCQEDPAWVVPGNGNKAFFHEIQDLTISCGAGNPGCMGVNFLVSNTGGMRRVRLLCEGTGCDTGVQMLRYGPGPLLLHDVEILGPWAHGIDISQLEFSVTIENLTCTGYLSECIRNGQNSLAIRHLTSSGQGPAIRNTAAEGLVVLLDSDLTGPSGDAIVNSGKLFARNVALHGFADLVPGVLGPTVAEYVSHGPFRANGADSATSLNLPIQETPSSFSSDAANDRINCEAFGAAPNTESGPAIRAALSTGRPIVYCTGHGTYKTNQEIPIPASARVIDLLGASLQIQTNLPKPGCLFRVDTPGPPITIRRGWIAGYDGALCITAARTVIVQDLSFGGGSTISVAAGAGPLYLEDVGAARLVVSAGAKVYARQFNPEFGAPMSIDNAGTVWVLGLKTEGAQTITTTHGTGCTEILGGLIYPVASASGLTMHVVEEGGQASFSLAESSYNAEFTTWLHETRGGSTWDLLASVLPARAGGRNVPLLSAHVGGCGL